MRESERTESVWKATRPLRELPPLRGEAQADVCVVGAGIAGIATSTAAMKIGERFIGAPDRW